MEFKTSIKIRKKGLNYYTDYIDKYFEDAFSKYGFHLVKNPTHSEHSLYMFIDNSPWMTVASKKLDELEVACLQGLASDISMAFKAVTYIEPFNLSKYESVIELHFSSQHNAFEEPSFIHEGETMLKWLSSDISCKSRQPFILRCLNYGGISRGLELYISGDFVEKDTATFDPLVIHSYDYSRKDKRLLTFEAKQQKIKQSDGRSIYLYDFADFEFPEGINQYSAKLRGKKGDNERYARSLYLYFISVGNQNELDTMCISILPKCNRACGVQWHHY